MCGIFGYIGEKRDATATVLEGLKRLDYRGYDSWGVGISDGSDIKIEKHAGKIDVGGVGEHGGKVASKAFQKKAQGHRKHDQIAEGHPGGERAQHGEDQEFDPATFPRC